MKKFMKKALSVMLALALIFVPISANAAEGDLGTDTNPYQLSTTSNRFYVYVEAGQEAWVQVDDDNGSTVEVGYATGSDYMIVYCRQPYYPETESGTLSFTMNDGADMFSVYNSGEEAVSVYMSLTAGAPQDTTGTMDNPEVVTLEKNPYSGTLGAFIYKEFEAGNQGRFYTITAPEDGYISVMLNVTDNDWNPVGWMYYVNNITAGKYGDMHWSDEEEPVNSESIQVSAGDEVEVFVTTYNPNDMWNAPAGNVSVNFGFSTVGSQEYPEKVVLEDAFGVQGAGMEQALEAGNNGYYYTVTAPADGVMIIGIGAFDEEWNEVGWMFNVNNLTSFVYGDMHWSDDEEVVDYEFVDVKEGDVVEIYASTYDPNDWNNPEGIIYVSVVFGVEGSFVNPEEAVAGSYATEVLGESLGYYYVFTATEAGTLTVSMDDADKWMYVVSNDTTGDLRDTHTYVDDEVVTSEEMEVAAGDVVSIGICKYDAAEEALIDGVVNWTLSFEADGTSGGDDSGNTGDGGDDSGNNGDDSGEVGGDDTDVNYEQSTTPLVLGTEVYNVSNMYPYTVYTFEPTEVGKYTISSDDSVLGIVSYNGMWLSVDPSAETVASDSIEWDCTSVGQGIWVAVLADTNEATITVSKEGLVINTITWTDYENKVEPEAFELVLGEDDEILYFLDEGIDTIVLGEDGYYHVNTADGPIVLIQLTTGVNPVPCGIDFAQAAGFSALGVVTEYDADGNAVTGIKFVNAVLEYLACVDAATGMYPLTEDLMTLYQVYGTSQGWYDKDSATGFYIFGEEEVDPETGWMFACAYVDYADDTNNDNTNNDDTNNDNTNNDDSNNGGTNNNDSADKEDGTIKDTGDATVTFITMIVFLGAVLVIAGFATKRRFA